MCKLTQSEREWLAAIEAEWAATTPGTWYAHLTDDAHYMNATYVSTVPGPVTQGFVVDNNNGMAEGSPNQAEHERVVAITLLQEPRLADADQSDPNTLFIAHVHQHIPRLLDLTRLCLRPTRCREGKPLVAGTKGVRYTDSI